MQLFKKVQKIIESSGILANSRVRAKEFDHSSITLMYGEHGTSIRLSAEKKFGKIGGKETGYRYRCVSTVRRGDSVFAEDASSILRMFRNFCSRTDEIDSFHENCKKILPKQQMNINKGSHSVEFDLSKNVVLSVWMSLHVSSSLYSCDTSLDLTPIGSGERRMQLSYLEGEDLNALISESMKICERRMSSMKNLLASNCVEIGRDEVKLGKQEILNLVATQAKWILSPSVYCIKNLDRSRMVRREINVYHDERVGRIDSFGSLLEKHGVAVDDFVNELILAHDIIDKRFLVASLKDIAYRYGLKLPVIKQEIGKQEILNLIIYHTKNNILNDLMAVDCTKSVDTSNIDLREINRYFVAGVRVDTFKEFLVRNGVGVDDFVEELSEIHDLVDKQYLMSSLSEFAACHGLYYSGI